MGGLGMGLMESHASLGRRNVRAIAQIYLTVLPAASNFTSLLFAPVLIAAS
jgi:hypothetical protein